MGTKTTTEVVCDRCGKTIAQVGELPELADHQAYRLWSDGGWVGTVEHGGTTEAFGSTPTEDAVVAGIAAGHGWQDLDVPCDVRVRSLLRHEMGLKPRPKKEDLPPEPEEADSAAES